jgi:hypothetical protein
MPVLYIIVEWESSPEKLEFHEIFVVWAHLFDVGSHCVVIEGEVLLRPEEAS